VNIPLNPFGISRPLPPGVISLAAARAEQTPHPRRLCNTVIKFPQRPDASVLDTTIPLFYIGQNKNGFWVAREAEGRSGGIFLLKRSAVRFARKQSEPAGCATMFLAEPFELDIENQGSRLVAAAMDNAAGGAPSFAAFVGMALAEWWKLIAQVSCALASERRNRDAIEKELFRDQYTLSSKNDDDLPLP